MKSVLKGEKNGILLLLLLGLLFILWGRILTYEIIKEMHTANLDTLNKRINCVESFGWVVDYGSEKSEKIRLPEEFDEVYENYNELQKKSGFDFYKYRGKTVTKYSYIILNPPEESKDLFYANIYVYENHMIGGDVMTPALNGMMLPIVR